MQVTVLVGGKFHAFEQAYQLERRGVLSRFITSYPRFAVTPYGIPSEKIRTVIFKELIQRGWRTLPKVIRDAYDPNYALPGLFDMFAERHIDMCDLFIGYSSFCLRSLQKARILGAKTIVERAGSHIEYQRDILREEYARAGYHMKISEPTHPDIIERELREYDEANNICVPSSYVAQTFYEKGIEKDKIVQIPLAVDLALFSPAQKRDSIFRVIFAGGLTLQKGVHYLLQAFSELQLPQSELHLIGPVSAQIEPFLKKYEGVFRRSDYYPMHALADVYSQGSVFVFPSLDDGFGLVILQAMACGLPVIATNHSGGPDVFQNGSEGYIISIRDVEALKEKILYLYEHPEERHAMGIRARERVARGFSWHDYGNAVYDAYSRLHEAK